MMEGVEQRGPRLWRLTGHAACAAALGDGEAVRKLPERALAAMAPGPFREHNAHTMTFMDPPHHGRVRRALAAHFTPRALAALQPLIVETATGLALGLARRRRADFIAAFAATLPIRVIAAILGVAPSGEARLRRCAAAVVAALEPDADAAARAAGDAAIAELAAFIGRTRRRPDGLLALLEASDALSADEALHQAIFVLNAGHETTAFVLARGAATLMAEPDARAALGDDPARWTQAADELLRLHPPLQWLVRHTVAPLAMPGGELPAGATLICDLAAANRDARLFAAPERFDPFRANARQHLSFAAGRHTCLGAALARAEIATGLRILFRHLPALRPAAPLLLRRGGIFHGVRRMPVLTGGPDAA
ncbi:cytochrome P450 [Sandaracinobacteroides saxicola]|uniref:Cytochrome P450 n=1 Tax=Sandaracinobacteroides saxicola TaxID=2759707 RepID=A0A7G5ILF3_9SPHN|nr:cytochrome P450 [Sandaracinobacteroides saxicola]QMW24195.1 cytochrome P450 [Sandaracinobacteroides saxicola]